MKPHTKFQIVCPSFVFNKYIKHVNLNVLDIQWIGNARERHKIELFFTLRAILIEIYTYKQIDKQKVSWE